jgi:rhamnosyltransferase subunit B
MRRWLLSSWGSAGDVYPFLALAKGLVARGHSVTLALDPMWEAKAFLTGARFVPLLKESQKEVLQSMPQVITSAALGMKALKLLMRHGVAPAYREAFGVLYQEAGDHDAVVAHHFAFPAAAAAEAMDIPLFTVTLAPGITPGENHVPAGVPFRWPRFLSPLARLIWWVGRYTIRLAVDSVLNPIRVSLGLPKRVDLFFAGFRRDYLLQLYSAHFAEAALDWPSDWKPLGFAFWDEAWDERSCDCALSSFLVGGEAPWLFTLGTTVVEHPGDFFNLSQEGIGSRRAIFLAGRHALTLKLLFSKYANVYITDYLPLHFILPRCVGAVHQCGIGTLAQVLRAGIPSVAVPFAFDQSQNAIRLEDHHLAINIPALKFSSAKLSSALTMLENDRTYSVNAAAFAKKILAEDGVGNAIKRLESCSL